jgi:hypothetical protein
LSLLIEPDRNLPASPLPGEGVAAARANPQGMTTEHEASRRLVKSPPELWAECSEADSLARHLSDSFGEIRITRLEPETTVAWEGEHASGTVRIEPSAWGTRVTLTADVKADANGGNSQAQVEVGVIHEEPDITEEEPAVDNEEPDLIPEAQPDPLVAQTPEPGPLAVDDHESEPRRRLRLMARMRAFFRRSGGELGPEAEGMPEATAVPAVPAPEAAPAPQAPAAAEAVAPAPEAEAVALAPEAAAPEPEGEAPPEEAPPVDADTDPPPQPAPTIDAQAILTAALESLGQAHHRPFSRA